jgi:hypothetical protein
MPARTLFALLFAVMIGSPALAQQDKGSDRGDKAEKRDKGDKADKPDKSERGRGNLDPAAFRERITGMMKEQMGATDEEWKVIEPKLTKVWNARRDAGGRGGPGGFGGGGFAGNRGGDSTSDASPVQSASRELRQVLENKDASPEQIGAKLKDLREAKEKAKETLASAQKDLKEVLTQRQEAVLVMFGMLD